MMLKSLKTMMIGALLTISNLANAGLISVNFDFGWGTEDYSGSFSGEDINLDGFVSITELTAISGGYSGEYNLGDISGFGDFELDNVTWHANAISWNGFPDTAFMTFNNRAWSCTTYNGCSVTITSFVESDNGNPASIPEPSTLAIFALGILGLGLRKAKK